MKRGLPIVMCLLSLVPVACDDGTSKEGHRRSPPNSATSRHVSTTTSSSTAPPDPQPSRAGDQSPSGVPEAPPSDFEVPTALLELEDLPQGFHTGRARSYDSVPQAFLCPNLRSSLPTPMRREGAVFSGGGAVPSIVEQVVMKFDSPAAASRFARSLRDAPTTCPASFQTGTGSGATTQVRLQPLASPEGQQVAASFRATAGGANAGTVDVVLVGSGRYATVLLDVGPVKFPPGTLFTFADRALGRLSASNQ